jgi:predicted nucleic acid-binding protein
VIVLDTSVLIDGLTGLKRSAPAIRESLAEGERMLLPALVLYEWLRGPRLSQELAAQEALFPAKSAIPFGPEEAAVAAGLCRIVKHHTVKRRTVKHRTVKRSRGREVDLGIAACALVRGAYLWTLNPRVFRDVPGIRLYRLR